MTTSRPRHSMTVMVGSGTQGMVGLHASPIGGRMTTPSQFKGSVFVSMVFQVAVELCVQQVVVAQS